MGLHSPLPDPLNGLIAVGHPRPLLRRREWWSLDGTWDFALDREESWSHPDEVEWNANIEVPFAPETEASGVHHEAYTRACWYRRSITAPPGLREGERVLLHFGAVDYTASVWLDGHFVGVHIGGYSPFHFDVSRELRDGEAHVLCVRAFDDPLDLAKPRGKQDWEPLPHAIWYHRTTGIWQSVWMERVPRVAIEEIQWNCDIHHIGISLEARVSPPIPDGHTLRVRLAGAGHLLVDDTIAVLRSATVRDFRIGSTGLDHHLEDLLWSPQSPNLIEAVLELRDAEGALVDEVFSYTALREVELRAGRFVLNGRPQQLRLVLDQGYWEGTGLTPPSDDAIRRDVELVKAMGFNGVRKHQKIEDPRYLYWADRLGLFVWVEMPPAYQFDSLAMRRVTDEWMNVIRRHRSHPSIVAWVPFNESSGLLSLPAREDQQQWVRAMTALTKALDPTRPVVANDGWEVIGGDIIAVHDYDQDPRSLAARWNGDLREPLTGYPAHGRLQTLDEDADSWSGGRPSRPIMLTEFGGIGWAPEAPAPEHDEAPGPEAPEDRLSQPASWGYSTVASAEQFAGRYAALMAAVHSCGRLAGFCYTQLADTFQEVNGLLRPDRTPKIPIEQIAEATLGPDRPFFDPL